MAWVTEARAIAQQPAKSRATMYRTEDGNDDQENFPLVHDRRGHARVVLSVPLTAQDNSSQAHRQSCRCFGDFGASPGLGQAARHAALWISRGQPGPSHSHASRCARCRPRGTEDCRAAQRITRSASMFLDSATASPATPYTDAPPDTDMAVGDTQIVEWVNISWAVFDKSGNPLTGAHRWQRPLGVGHPRDLVR